MNEFLENRYFLTIKKEKILFTALDNIEEPILEKKLPITGSSDENIYSFVEHFLEKNIFGIEKDLKNFIKKIYIIFESDSFFSIGSSIKRNLENTNLDYTQIQDSLIDIRKQFNKYSPEFETIHMIMNEFIVDGIKYETLPEKSGVKNLIIQINFICLEKKKVEKFKEIFLKYQISIDKILSYDYIKNLNKENNLNISLVANNILNGQNINEVLMIKKTSKNQGFFEKFFNFFN